MNVLGRHDDLVARADSQRGQGQVQGGNPVAGGQGVFDAEFLRILFFKAPDLWTGDRSHPPVTENGCYIGQVLLAEQRPLRPWGRPHRLPAVKGEFLTHFVLLPPRTHRVFFQAGNRAASPCRDIPTTQSSFDRPWILGSSTGPATPRALTRPCRPAAAPGKLPPCSTKRCRPASAGSPSCSAGSPTVCPWTTGPRPRPRRSC